MDIITGNKITSYSNINDNSLTELEIPEGVVSIGERAFYGCSKLIKITIPTSVKQIADEAFGMCRNLTTVIFKGEPEVIGNIFKGCSKLRDIILSDQNIRTYSFDATEEFAITILKKDFLEEDVQVYIGRVFPGEGFPFNIRADLSKKPLYFVETNRNPETVWFDDELQRAVISSKYKSSNQSFKDFFGVELNDEVEISYEMFALLTGICNLGRGLWKYSTNNREKVKIGYIKEVLNRNTHIFGIAEIKKRFQEAIDKQEEVFNNLNIHNTISSKLFLKDLKKWLFEK